MFSIRFHQLTSAGDRDYNQDYMLNKIDDDYMVFVLADGLGGHQAGEKASSLFCHSFIRLAPQFVLKLEPAPEAQILAWFNAAVALMAEASQGDPAMDDAYTTCAILIITATQVISIHCGDSRVYRLNPQEGIAWRTRDHSIPQQLLDQGQLEERYMGTHPEQNQLTRSINIHNKFLPEIALHSPAQAGDVFILCSDGFWEFTKEQEFIALAEKANMQRSDLLKQAKMTLVRAAGASDNITVQWLKIEAVNRDID